MSSGFLRWVCVVAMCWTMVMGQTRVYYVGVVEEEWDYTPKGAGDADAESNPDQDQQNEQRRVFVEARAERVGSRYVKAMYREFTDDTFSQRSPRVPWTGMLGPVVVGERGDVVRVVFKNMAYTAGRNFSMEPSVALSTHGGEPSGEGKGMPMASPGQVVTWDWVITNSSSPSDGDPECLTWTYQSHVDVVRDVNTGLIGVFLTCRPGATAEIKRKYSAQLSVLLSVIDENRSWYMDHNINTYLPEVPRSARGPLKANKDFKESNRMHGINGVVFGHLAGLNVCVDTTVLWHLVGMGNAKDVHTISVSGHFFKVNGHRHNAIGLNPANSVTATLMVREIGQWRIHCNVFDHAKAGMVAMLNARSCEANAHVVPHLNAQRFLNYYIAVDEVDWNYAPSAVDGVDGRSLLPIDGAYERYLQRDSGRMGGVYRKALYRQYEDITFSTRHRRGPEDKHLGYLGPVLRLQVGDLLSLTLRNNARRPFAIHLHGATLVDMVNRDGSPGNHSSSGPYYHNAVQPNHVKTTYWFISDDMGPGPMDPPCVTGIYTSSSSDITRDVNSGLIGPMLVCRKGALDGRNRQHQVDREFFLMLSAADENLSWYSEHNFRGIIAERKEEAFYQSNLMHSLNGFVYGYLPGLDTCVNDRTVWHVFSVGSTHDVHSFSVYGQPLTELDMHPGASLLLPGYFKTLFVKAQNPGKWAAACEASDHNTAGARALLTVRDCGLKRDFTLPFSRGGQHRKFFLQAEEEYWDYSPSGLDQTTGRNLSSSEYDSYIYTRSDGPYLGTVYKKARYLQYTSETFSKKIERDQKDQYLGILGPIIMAEVHDTITIVFRNSATRQYSIHIQGLPHKKPTEEAQSERGGVGVQPGEATEYQWEVTADWGPAEGDPPCIARAYYSTVDPVRDTTSGLIGPLVICKPGLLSNVTGTQSDVEKAVVLLFKVFDETQSWYVEDNIRRFGSSTSRESQDFVESCLMHSINGYMYGNNPAIQLSPNSTVDWHLLTLGGQLDLYSVRFHGNSVRSWESDRRTDSAVRLFPGASRSVRMTAATEGEWPVYCQGHDHLVAGMITSYVVKGLRPPVTTTADPFGDIDAS